MTNNTGRMLLVSSVKVGHGSLVETGFSVTDYETGESVYYSSPFYGHDILLAELDSYGIRVAKTRAEKFSKEHDCIAQVSQWFEADTGQWDIESTYHC